MCQQRDQLQLMLSIETFVYWGCLNQFKGSTEPSDFPMIVSGTVSFSPFSLCSSQGTV